MEFPSLAVSSDWCHAASCCCCHWQKFLSLIPMRRKKVSVLLLQLPRLSFVCSTVLNRHLNANTDRIQNFKRNLLIGFVEGLCPRTSHFSDLKEKMKNTFARTRVATSFRIPPLFGCYWYFKRINEDETALCLLQRTLDMYFFPHFTEALLSKQPINTKKFPIELH